MDKIKIEFAVQMRGEKSAEKVLKCLETDGDVEVDLKQGRVVINTTRPWCEIHEKIEQTGSKAVLCGFGGQSAVAMVGDFKPEAKVKGVVRFAAISQNRDGCVIDGVIDGLSPGLHGIHVHECGDISQGCTSVGNHYNPRGSPHGGPDNSADHRHAGDLGNIRANDEGRATFRFIDTILQVPDIIGRSVVVTANPDDLGRGGSDTSLIDGNSGQRIACGIIARSAGIFQNYKKICACDGVTLWDERKKPLAGGDRRSNGNL